VWLFLNNYGLSFQFTSLYCDITAERQNSEGGEMAIARKWLSKHAPAATDMHTTMEELLHVVFPVWPLLRLYIEDRWEKLVSKSVHDFKLTD
jgi:hypothetical protein